MKKQIFLWCCVLPLVLFIKIVSMILAPLNAAFITSAERTDRVKRLGNAQVTMQRDYLVRRLYWFQTHDNAVDEYWYGCFNESSVLRYLREATQEQYNTSWKLRWLCRVMWLWRNCAYGFSYNLFGRDLNGEETLAETGNEQSGYWKKLIFRSNSWQLKAHYPIGFHIYIDINIGWKTHRGFPRAMFASRIFSLRRS